jgi:hypothetical protein
MNGKEQAGMGIACGDCDGDGREDLLVTNFSGENNALYLSRAAKAFSERSGPSGIGGPSIPRLGWGTALADFDLDGDLDGFAMNGHVYPQADRPGTDTSYAQRSDFYRGDGTGKFDFDRLYDGPDRVMRASTIGDIDGDGDLDIVAIELDGPVCVLRNVTLPRASEERPHWLRVELRSARGNRFALGARVEAQWEGGKRSTEIRTSGGFQSAVPPEAHFGLGRSTSVARLAVTFPSGVEVVRENVAADQVLRIDEPEAK